MSMLRVTLIDVGWGDSILIESTTTAGQSSYGLIDCNDTTSLQSSFIFLKRFFEKKKIDIKTSKPLFDFVVLSHAHTDHGQGLKNIMKHFGTKYFWYSKSDSAGLLSTLTAFADKPGNDDVAHHEALNSTKILPDMGDVKLSVMWPHYNSIPDDNENNNSVVLLLTLDQASFVLTGDAEGKVWDQIATDIPNDVQFFKVPHHGSVNGTFWNGQTPWLDACPGQTRLGISSHIRPFSHPDKEVVDVIDQRGYQYYRTDEHYHVTFSTDGNTMQVKYSHE